MTRNLRLAASLALLLVSTVEPRAETATPDAAVADAPFFTVMGLSAGDLLNVRATASPVGMVVGRMPNGSRLKNRGCETVNANRWCKVEDAEGGGIAGWAPARYLADNESMDDGVEAGGDLPDAPAAMASVAEATAAARRVSEAMARTTGAVVAVPAQDYTDDAGADDETETFPQPADVPIPEPRPVLAGETPLAPTPTEGIVVAALAPDAPTAPAGPKAAKPDAGKTAAAPPLATVEPPKAMAAIPPAATPDPAKADLSKADVAKTGLGKTDSDKTDLGKTDLGKTDLGKTDLGKTDLGKTDLGKAVADKPVAAPKDSVAVAAIEALDTKTDQTARTRFGDGLPADLLAAIVPGEAEGMATGSVPGGRAAAETGADAAAAPKEAEIAAAEPAPPKPQVFDWTGQIPCARYFGQPMMRCEAGVVHGAKGAATVTVSWPDGGKRIIQFKDRKPAGSDAAGELRFTREADLSLIRIGQGERFEIIDDLPFGG